MSLCWRKGGRNHPSAGKTIKTNTKPLTSFFAKESKSNFDFVFSYLDRKRICKINRIEFNKKKVVVFHKAKMQVLSFISKIHKMLGHDWDRS